MDKLVIDNGGMPLHGDDFRFIDAGIREAFKGLLYGLCPPDCILGGLRYTRIGNVYTIEEGFVCLDYEICYVPAVIVTKGQGEEIQIFPDNSWDINGLDVFANNTSNNTYEVRRARCYSTGIVTNGLNLLHGTRLEYNLSDLITSVSLASSSAFSFIAASNGYQSNPPLKLYKDGNVKHLDGVITIPVSIPNQQDTLIINIQDSDYHPTRQVFAVVCLEGGGGEQHFAKITIGTNGNIYIYKYDNSNISYEYVYINISFL